MRERERERENKAEGCTPAPLIRFPERQQDARFYRRQLRNHPPYTVDNPKKPVCGQCGGTIEPGLLSTTMKLNMLNLEALKRRGSHYKR